MESLANVTIISVDIDTLLSIANSNVDLNTLEQTDLPVPGSNTKFEYVVSVRPGTSIDDLQLQLVTDTSLDDTVPSNIIPDRPVDIADERLACEFQTHFYLTPGEAANLKNDPRVIDVELCPSHNPFIKLSPTGQATYNYGKQAVFGFGGENYKNYALLRCNSPTQNYNTEANVSVIGTYEYTLDGTGVDVIIMDNGVLPDHPEWEDANGNSRFQQIDWFAVTGVSGTQSPNYYTVADDSETDHGTCCASIVAGKTFGWAKNANIYSMKVTDIGGTDGFSATTAFELIKEFHLTKSVDPNTGFKRPTVVNASWGVLNYYVTGGSLSPTYQPYLGRGSVYLGYSQLGNRYRGTDQFASSSVSAPLFRDTAKGHTGTFLGYINSGHGEFLEFYRVSGQSTTYDLLVEDCINAGVHFIHSSGNEGVKNTRFDDVDFNNIIYTLNNVSPTVTYNSVFYHRPESPFANTAHQVGSVDSELFNTQEKRAYYSNFGSSVNIYAPGSGIVCASAGNNGVPYFEDSNYEQRNNSGTSFAAPQVAGVLACYLSANPGITPANGYRWISNVASVANVMYSTQSSTDYANVLSLGGGPNKFLFNPFNTDNAANVRSGIKVSYTFIKYS